MSAQNQLDISQVNLQELARQVKTSSPQFDKIKERAAGARYQSYKIQLLEKISKIEKLDQDRQKYMADIAEYLSHMSKMGFEYGKPIPAGQKIGGSPVRKLPGRPVKKAVVAPEQSFNGADNADDMDLSTDDNDQ